MTAIDRAFRQGFQATLQASGVTATYFPVGGLEADEITIRGDFLEKYDRIDPVTLQVISSTPAFECDESDVSDAQDGDRILINGEYFNAIEAKRNFDGVGNTMFILSRDTALPLAPSRLNAQLNLGVINLAWTRNATNNTAVEVWCDEDGDGAYLLLATLAAGITAYTDSSGTVSVAYRVRNTNKSGPSKFTHIFNTQLWALVDESGNYITDESGSAIVPPSQ